MKRFCTFCGRELNEGAKYCPQCGREVPRDTWEEKQTEKKPNNNPNNDPNNNPNNNSNNNPEGSVFTPDSSKNKISISIGTGVGWIGWQRERVLSKWISFGLECL